MKKSLFTAVALAAAGAPLMLSGAPAMADVKFPPTFPQAGPVRIVVADPAADVTGSVRGAHRVDVSQVTYRTIFNHRAYGTAVEIKVNLAGVPDRSGLEHFTTRIVADNGQRFLVRVSASNMTIFRVLPDGTWRELYVDSSWGWGADSKVGGGQLHAVMPASVFRSASLTSLRTTLTLGMRTAFDRTDATVEPLRLAMVR